MQLLDAVDMSGSGRPESWAVRWTYEKRYPVDVSLRRKWAASAVVSGDYEMRWMLLWMQVGDHI
jgi:hypothetical protein